jgi:hypothetical protein
MQCAVMLCTHREAAQLVHFEAVANLVRCALLCVVAAAGNSRGSAGNNNIVNCLVHNTLTVNISASYTPPCSGTIAVIVLPCDNAGATPAQITIAQVSISSVPVECSCEVSRAQGGCIQTAQQASVHSCRVCWPKHALACRSRMQCCGL